MPASAVARLSAFVDSVQSGAVEFTVPFTARVEVSIELGFGICTRMGYESGEIGDESRNYFANDGT